MPVGKVPCIYSSVWALVYITSLLYVFLNTYFHNIGLF